MYFSMNLCILPDLKVLALLEVMRCGIPKWYMMCHFRKLMALLLHLAQGYNFFPPGEVEHYNKDEAMAQQR
jgi:hypothetical protein